MKQDKLNETMERQRLIEELHSKGMSFRDIGEQLCVSRQRVHQIYKKQYKTHFVNYRVVYPKIKDWLLANNVEIKDLVEATGMKTPNVRAELAGTERMNMKLATYFERAIGEPLDILLVRPAETVLPKGYAKEQQ